MGPSTLHMIHAAGKRTRLAPPEKDVIERVAQGLVTQKTLAARLMEHIERFDSDMVRC